MRAAVSVEIKPCRIVRKPETGCRPLRLQFGARVGDDLIADPDQCGDEQDLKGKSCPARTAAEGALQPEGKLRRWLSGLDCHRRSRPARSADRGRILNSTLVPELIESTGNPELFAGTHVAIARFPVI